jgi:MFS family permease
MSHSQTSIIHVTLEIEWLITAQLQEYYHLTFLVISLVFLSPLVGYTASALLNNTIHLKFGQRGVAIIAPTCHLLAYIVIAVHPPYPVLVIIFMLAGFGNGLTDAAWSKFVIEDIDNIPDDMGQMPGSATWQTQTKS